MMFGKLKISDELSLNVFGEELRLEKLKNYIVYSRGDKRLKAYYSTKSPVIELRPRPPVGKYLGFIVVYFQNPLIVPRDTVVDVWTSTRVGVDVLVDGVVDSFNNGFLKRCMSDLFQNPVITGCHYSTMSDNPPAVGGVNTVIKNESSKPLRVEHVPIFTRDVPMFYDKDRVYYPWQKIVVDNSGASLYTNFTSPVSNLVSTGLSKMRFFDVKLKTKIEREFVVI